MRECPERGIVRVELLGLELLPSHLVKVPRLAAAPAAPNLSLVAKKSNVAGKVHVHRGPGADVLATFEADSADAIFIDADKAGYQTYLREGLRIVREGGLILVDNALAFGEILNASSTDASVLAVRAFNEVMAQEKRVHGVIVPIGDGLWVGVRLA